MWHADGTRQRPTEAVVNTARLIREGRRWTITFEAKELHLPDLNGVRILARLLDQPDAPIPATELMAPLVAHPPTAGQARIAVWKALRAVLRRIDAAQPELAWYLRTTIRTGASCVFRPDPRHPTNWLIDA